MRAILPRGLMFFSCLLLGLGVPGFGIPSQRSFAQDCNNNGAPDAADILAGFSQDCNNNGTPDECDFSVPRLGFLSRGLKVELTPHRVQSVDFNRDRRLDVLVASKGEIESTLYVFPGHDSKRFGAAMAHPMPGNLEDFATADLDGDGDVDVASVHDAELRVRIQTADGSLIETESFAVPDGRHRVFAHDLDGDAAMDLVVLSEEAGEVTILFNEGSGSFVNPTALLNGTHPTCLAVEDLDADGRLDLILSNRDTNGVSVFLQPTKKRFSGPVLYDTEKDKLHFVTTADVRGDGDRDVICVGLEGVTVLENDGLGALAVSTQFERRSDIATAADFDGDGDLDLALLEKKSEQVSILIHTSNGNFVGLEPFNVESSPVDLAASDADNDDDVDLLILGGNQRSVVFAWNGTPQGVALRKETAPMGRRPHGGDRADLNQDGHMDVILSSGHNRTVSVLLGGTNGALSKPKNFRIEDGGHLNSVHAGDLDGDGVPDVVTADRQENRLSVFVSDGKGNLAEPFHVETGGTPDMLEIADLNGDGRNDLVSVNETDNTVTTLFQRGSLVFEGRVDHRVGVRPLCVVAADLNGDGPLDLAVSNDTSQTVSILINLGDGRFAPHVEYPTIRESLWIDAGDLDTDGDVDLVASAGVARTIVQLTNRGDGTFEFSTFDLPRAPRRIGLDDINSDGKLDLIALSTANSAVMISLGNGQGAFNEPFLLPVGELPRVVVTGDFDSDGGVDILTGNRISEDVSILWNATPTPPQTEMLATLCTEADFQLLTSVSDDPIPPKTIRFALPLTTESRLPSPVFWNPDLFEGTRDFLRAKLDPVFGELTESEYTRLALERQNREMYVGEITRLAPESVGAEVGFAYGFRVDVDEASASQRLSLAETTAVYEELKKVFRVTPLGYRPAAGEESEVAATWREPTFSIFPNPLQDSINRFRRGDSNSDGVRDIADAGYTLNFLFIGGPAPLCRKAADVDDSGRLDLTDALYLLNFLFLSGRTPPPPHVECGRDTTTDPLSCQRFPVCP